MTGPATGRPTVFSLCAIVCIYMLGIRCKSRSLPKGLKRSCQFVFFIIQSKVLRQTLSELFFNKKLQTFSLGNLRWNFFIAQRSARKSTLGDSEFVSACPKRHFIFATLLAGYVRRSLKFISTKYRVHTFFFDLNNFVFGFECRRVRWFAVRLWQKKKIISSFSSEKLLLF